MNVSSRRLLGGFGLLEAIVAIAILGTSGLMLFGWINDNLLTASRLKDAEQRATIQLEVSGYIAKLNPALRPEGQDRIGDLQVEWKSMLLEPMRDEFNYDGYITPHWRLGLFRVSVRARKASTGVQDEWTQIVAGWRAIGGAPSTSLSGAGS